MVTAALTSCKLRAKFRVWGPLYCSVLAWGMLQQLGTSLRFLQSQQGDSEITSQGSLGGYLGAVLVEEELGEPETPGHGGWQGHQEAQQEVVTANQGKIGLKGRARGETRPAELDEADQAV